MRSFFNKIISYFFLSSKEKLPHDKSTHLTYLCLIGALLILPFFFHFNKNNTAGLSFTNFKIPPLCMSKAIFNAECPGCGMTRSFVKIAKGEFLAAFNFNRVSILLFLYFIFAVFYHGYCLRILDKDIPEKLVITNRIFANAVLILLITNWILGLYIGSNGGLPK